MKASPSIAVSSGTSPVALLDVRALEGLRGGGRHIVRRSPNPRGDSRGARPRFSVNSTRPLIAASAKRRPVNVVFSGSSAEEEGDMGSRHQPGRSYFRCLRWQQSPSSSSLRSALASEERSPLLGRARSRAGGACSVTFSRAGCFAPPTRLLTPTRSAALRPAALLSGRTAPPSRGALP